MNDVSKIHLIEAYHLRCLDTDEQAQFDNLYLSDMDFAKEVEDFQPIFAGFEMLHLEAFEQQMQGWEQKHQQKILAHNFSAAQTSAKTNRWKQRFIGYLAAAAIFIAAPMLYFNLKQPNDNFELFFQPNTNLALLPSVRAGGLTDAQELEKKAIEAYIKKDFVAALPFMEQYNLQHKDSTRVIKHFRLYMGISQLALAKNEESIKSLREFLSFSDESLHDYRQEAEWMLGLAYYRKGDNDQSRQILQAIANDPKNEYCSNAKKMLGILDQK
jgi:hypothetical protein